MSASALAACESHQRAGDQPRFGQAPPSSALPVAQAARVTTKRAAAPSRQGRTLPARQVSQMRMKERSSWSADSEPPRYPASADQGSGASSAPKPDTKWCAARPLLYFAAVQSSELWLGISNCFSDLWSYGDSNPRPLACHSVAPRPQQYICAGHSPGASARVHRDLRLLRYFSAVRIQASPPPRELHDPPAGPPRSRSRHPPAGRLHARQTSSDLTKRTAVTVELTSSDQWAHEVCLSSAMPSPPA
jgi:hypothetical protein